MSTPEQWVQDLEEWHLAREEANRYNRNLLQYGAAVAAVFGIGAGSGSVLALASAQNDQGETSALLWGGGGLAGALLVFSVILAFLLVHAFRQRRSAERRADEYHRKLVRHAPERFLPKQEE